MNQPVKKSTSYFNLLIVLAGITVSVALVAASLLNRSKSNTDAAADPVLPQRLHPRELPCPVSEQPDTTVRHPAWYFNDATINTVLDTVWKRFGVCYAFEMPVNNRFTGTIPADASLNETLRLLVTMTPDSIRIERTTPGQIIVNPKCP